MHIHPLDAASQQDLELLINSHEFLSLSSSKTRYPDAPGSGLPLIEINTELCQAVVSLQGAQLLNFMPAGGKELLWTSPNCDFTPGEALRGGIPLCLPWFGADQENPNKQKHGFARNHFWQLASARQLADGAVELEFLFLSDANQLFAYDFSAELRMTLGKSAKLELTLNNTDTEDFTCSWAMHNYYAIDSLTQVQVKGLAGRNYLNNLDNLASETLNGNLQFEGPVDSIFFDIHNNLQIIGNPSIEIEHHNCPSVIAWNPGSATAAQVADIGAGQEQFYVCVERGAVRSECWSLAAGSSQSAWVEFKQI